MLTTKQLAKALKVSTSRALTLAKLRGVKPAFDGGKVWDDSAVKLLKPGPRGRPARKGVRL